MKISSIFLGSLVLAGTVGDARKCVSTRLQQGKKDEN
jgi:hypothetical protein